MCLKPLNVSTGVSSALLCNRDAWALGGNFNISSTSVTVLAPVTEIDGQKMPFFGYFIMINVAMYVLYVSGE